MSAWLSALRDLIVEATPLRRFMLALLVLVPLIALTTAYLRLNPPTYRVLYAQLSDRAGGEVIAALEQLNIPYRLSGANGSVEVAADQLHLARYRLAALGLPRSDADAQDEIERTPSFGASSLQEQQGYQRALEIDLARSIQKLDTVELARVHLALPKVSPFLRDAPSATAAVLVRLRPDAQLSAEQVSSIQTLVAASVPRLKRSEVQVLDPHGVLLGAPAPALEPSPQLALEQDLARRALTVLTPWLGADRVSVQITATLEDSETRQTIERVRRTGGGSEARPLEKTILTTRVPEGRVRRLNVIVILGFDASTAELKRAGKLTSQALGLMSSRGDTLNVYALPGTAPEPAATPAKVVVPPVAVPPVVPTQSISIPQVQPQHGSPAQAAPSFSLPLAGGLAGSVVLLLAVVLWWRRRQPPALELSMDDFDVELDTARTQVLQDPRVTADVIKLWMRA